MPYVEFVKPVRVTARMQPPSIRVNRSQGAAANKALALKIGLDKCRQYSVYVDADRKLIGLSIGDGKRYHASGSEKTHHTYILAAVTAALQEFGVDTDTAQAFPAATLNLPAPIVCQIDLSSAVMRKGGRK